MVRIIRYLFTWSGTSLTSVKVDILLANLSLPSLNSSTALSQYFKVSFLVLITLALIRYLVFLPNFSLSSSNSSTAFSQYLKVRRLRYFSSPPCLQVAFQHEKSAALETHENLEKDAGEKEISHERFHKKEIQQERSGNPYYKIGFPLITRRLEEEQVKPAGMSVKNTH